MEFKRVAIIGIGLIGGSFALSLRRSGFRGRIAGIGRNEKNLARAKDLGIIDEFFPNPASGVRDADLVLLSTPVGQFPEIVREMRESLKTGAIVTDVGSVKGEVIKQLEPLMPAGVSFVGGHPIAGKECSGIEAASADLFDKARCIITPCPTTDNNALEQIIGLWKSFGSETILMSPEEHDAIFAAVSHFPHVIAYVLVNTIMDERQDILPHGGRGLRDMTRIALSPPELWRDICFYNRENLLKSLERFISATSHIQGLITNSSWDELLREFERAKAGRQTLESD